MQRERPEANYVLMKFVGLIPARGGSKGIPQKSIATCAGKPLLAYTCEAALSSKSLTKTILSTDDAEIANLGKRLGVTVPFLRPAEFAKDDTPMIEVLRHAVDWLKSSGEIFDAIVLLQPTSPLRRANHIEEAVEQFQRFKAETVVSVVKVPHQFSPFSVLKKNDDQKLTPWLENQPSITHRQNKPVLYARNGPAVLVIRTETIQKGVLYPENTYAYEMSAADSLDVDDSQDLQAAERAITQRHA